MTRLPDSHPRARSSDAPTLAVRLAALAGQMPAAYVAAVLAPDDAPTGVLRAALAEAANVPQGDS